jgi:hypothetical protein
MDLAAKDQRDKNKQILDPLMEAKRFEQNRDEASSASKNVLKTGNVTLPPSSARRSRTAIVAGRVPPSENLSVSRIQMKPLTVAPAKRPGDFAPA